MDRRTFLVGAGTAAAAGLVPSPADAAERATPADDHGLRRRIEHLRGHRDRVHARTLRRLRIDAPDEAQDAYARSAAAMATIERLSHVPLRDQVHPAFQAFAGELADEVGRGVHATRRLIDAAVAADPPASALDAAFAQTEAGLEDEADLSDASRAVNRNSLRDLRDRVREEGLAAVGRREQRRLRRLVDLSERIAAAGGETGVLAPPNPAVLAEVEVGRRRWGDEGVPAPAAAPMSAGRVLGIVACGLGVLAGGFLVLMGVGCGLACDAPGLLVVALLGGVIIGLCVWGIVALARPQWTPPSDPDDPWRPDDGR